jgi:phosphoribosylformimino-5-aminoimidazole carboxamide ribotide isomerase
MREGVSKVICSSMAVRNEADWVKLLQKHSSESILGMDLKEGKIAYAGWLETAAESVDSFVTRMLEHGLKEILCTDISKDGTLAGPNQELYEELKFKFPEIRLIASGGVSSIDDLKKLASAGIDAVVVGKAYYEGHISLKEMYAISF